MSATATGDGVRTAGFSAMFRRAPTWLQVAVILGVWLAVWAVLKGTDTLFLSGQSKNDLHDSLGDWKDGLIAGRDSNIWMQATAWIGDQITTVGTWLQELVSQPAFPRPVPQIGWLGVVAIAGWIGFALAGWRIALLVIASFLSFGVLGYWEDSLDTLLVTLLAVAIALAIGLPLAVLMAKSKRFTATLRPMLDTLQTMPSFNYLLPIFLFFGLGFPGVVVATVIYATPPVIRIAAHGLTSVSATTLEATDSLGQSRWQRLRRVELPMAKSTIIVGVNQTTMAALSMVVIGGFIDSPGLGQPVLAALTAQQTGDGFVAGVCIVILAIMLDRTTTAASEHGERVARAGGRNRTRHRLVVAGTGVAALVCVYFSRLYSGLAEFPNITWGDSLSNAVQSFADSFTSTFDTALTAVNEGVTEGVLNPLQDLLADSPWYVTGTAIVALVWVLSGVWPTVVTAACLGGMLAVGLWYDSMLTLAMTLVGTLIVMALALVLGVWMARRPRVDLVLRPILDAAQVMPPFVYLIPALLLFGFGRFTAILAGVVYAAPIAIKLVADGIQRVSATTVEAAEASGSTPWQVITKVQLPMARGNLLLAANQGLLYVLSMVVIGGLIGAQALGYASVLGFSQSEFFGKGLAAAICIVLMGIMLDRVARGAAARQTERAAATDRMLVKTPIPAAPTG